MQIINLYRYEQSNGIVITPNQRDSEDVPHAYRLIADEGKSLVKDEVDIGQCIDTPTTDGFTETDGVDGEATEADYISALEEVGVEFNEEN